MKTPCRREWLPTPVLLPGEVHGQRSLVGYSPWGHQESDTTEWLTLSLFHFSLSLSAWVPSEYFFFFFSYEVKNQLTDRKATEPPLHINFLFLLNSFALLPKVQRVLGRANVYFDFFHYLAVYPWVNYFIYVYLYVPIFDMGRGETISLSQFKGFLWSDIFLCMQKSSDNERIEMYI